MDLLPSNKDATQGSCLWWKMEVEEALSSNQPSVGRKIGRVVVAARTVGEAVGRGRACWLLLTNECSLNSLGTTITMLER